MSTLHQHLKASRRSAHLFTAALCSIGGSIIFAGSSAMAAQVAAPASPKAVPTTRILAIGTLTARANDGALTPVLPTEVRDTVRLYLAGKLDQWFVKQDGTGVVFILNVTDPAEAKTMLEGLPLGKAGLMTFQLTPLGPLRPLGALLNK